MRFRPTIELCYMAGLTGKSNETERSKVAINTQSDEIAERFVKYALRLGVDPTKIVIEEKESFKSLFFYHSKLAKKIREVMKERTTLPRKSIDLAAAFVAGSFDANGHITSTTITMRRLERSDELLLELLGIHNVGSRILNISSFMSLIKNQSVLSGKMRFAGKTATHPS